MKVHNVVVHFRPGLIEGRNGGLLFIGDAHSVGLRDLSRTVGTLCGVQWSDHRKYLPGQVIRIRLKIQQDCLYVFLFFFGGEALLAVR